MSRFIVSFSDGEKLVFNDIIIFDDAQKDEIKGIAIEYTKYELQKVQRYGIDLSYLSDGQKQIVINTKNVMLEGKTSEEILDDDTVLVTLHSSERSLKRTGSNSRIDFINLVDRLKKIDTVTKAQFKGYPTLSYTTLEDSDPEAFKLPISFVRSKKGNRIIKIITVVPQGQSEVMEVSIAETDPVMALMLEKLREQLKKD